MKVSRIVAAAVFAAALVLTDCASQNAEKPTDRIVVKSAETPVTLEHKGTGVGIDKLPGWLSTYYDGSIANVEKMPEYKGQYCIIATEYGPQLQPLLTWVNNFNAQQQIGATIQTRVASTFKANERKVPADENSRRKYDNALNSVISATYTGARQQGDWWLKQKISSRGKSDEIRYTAFSFYTIDQKLLNEQIAGQVKKLKDGTPFLDAVLDDIAAQMLQRGLEWEE